MLALTTIVSIPQSHAQDRDVGCVGPLPDNLRRMYLIFERPLQRELFQGVRMDGGLNRPAAGTVIRVYSQPQDFIGDFDDDGVMDTVRAFTEYSGPDGADPCPDGPDGNGCLSGERIIEGPFKNSTGDWWMPAEPFTRSGNPIVRSETQLGEYTPNTYEFRFTEDDEGSFVHLYFTTERVVRMPIEVWDIGNVRPGEVNDPSDDVRLALTSFPGGIPATGGDECTFAFDEVDQGDGTWLSDRIGAYYFRDGFNYDRFHAAVEEYINEYPFELFNPLVGSFQTCENGKVSLFDCDGVNLHAYLPKEMIGGFMGLTDLWAWTDPVTGVEYALVGRTDGISFVDLSDPSNPVFVGELVTPTDVSTWRDVKVFADHAFIVADATDLGMQIFDLNQLRSVTNPPVLFEQTGRFTEFTNAHNIAINEETGFAYAVLTSTCPGLYMIDINNPQEPTFAGCFNEQERTHDVQCVIYQGPDTEHQGKEICVGSNESLLGIVDVTDKSAPVGLSTATYPNASYVHQGWFTDDQRYFLQNDELDDLVSNGYRTIIWDLADLDDPEVLTIYEGPVATTDHNLYIKGNRAYLANYQSGLRILDISDISSPEEIAFFDTYPLDNFKGFGGAWTAYPYLESGLILVSSREQGLFVLTTSPVPVSNETADRISTSYHLAQNYPNPVQDKTIIPYELPEATDVTIEVWDLLGRRVRTLYSGVQPAGQHELELHVGDLPNGLYLYRFSTATYSSTRRFVVAR